MIMKKKILLFIASASIFSSCDDLFEPALENQQGTEQMCVMIRNKRTRNLA